MQTTKKQLRIYTNALIKAVCESKLDAKVEVNKRWLTLWVHNDEGVIFMSSIYARVYTRKENHTKFKEMIRYLKGE